MIVGRDAEVMGPLANHSKRSEMDGLAFFRKERSTMVMADGSSMAMSVMTRTESEERFVQRMAIME